MKTYVTHLLLFITSSLFAQNQLGFIFHPLPRNTNEMSTIDSFNIKVFYAFNADTISNPNTYIDFQCLEIGEKFSKYYSYFIYNSDSLCTAWENKHPNARTTPWGLGNRGKYPYYWSEYKYSEYFVDHSTKQITEYSRMPRYMNSYNSQATEQIPMQQWTIHSDTISIIGYTCQKATCTFRGRNYVAWFALELTIDKGPWKFSGLPGLILKVYDDELQYRFECVKINIYRKNMPLKRYNYNSYKTIRRNELLEIQKAIHKNYYKMTGMKSRSEKPLPDLPEYMPLELF